MSTRTPFPSFFRSGRFIAFMALLAGLPGLAMAAPDAAVHMEADTYRAANTYESMRSAGTQACAAACTEDQRCAAWTVTPPTFRLGPRCELKTSAGQSVSRPGYVSGLSGMTQPAPQTVAARPSAPATRQPASQAVAAGTLAGGRNDTAVRAYASQNTPAGAATGTVYEGPNGPVAMSGMRPAPVTMAQPASTSAGRPDPVQRTQIASSIARTETRSPAVSPPTAASAQTAAQPTVKRTVTRRVVAEEPPAMIARPAEGDAARYVTKPAPQPVSSTPRQPQTPTVSTRTVPSTAQTASATTVTPPTRAARAPLPSPKERGVPAYSVQRMGQFPGDYDATAGYVEGLPENAKVESVRANNPQRDRKDDDKSDSSDESWPEEYPDPLGGVIGSEPLGEPDN